MNSAVFIPFLSFILLPAVCIVASLVSSRAEAKKAAQRRHAAAVCASVKEAERRRQIETRAAKSTAAPKRRRGRPRKNPAPEKQPDAIPSAPAAPTAPAEAQNAAETISHAPAPEQKSAPRGVFAGEDVAFTGTCPKMGRDAMILHTNRLGGKGWSRINTRCTLLVIGEKPGSQQLERAAKWHIRTITWQEWFKLAFGADALPDPAPELSLDEFAALTDNAA